MESMSFDNTGKTTPLGFSNDVDPITWHKLLDRKKLADLIFVSAPGPKFSQVANGWNSAVMLSLGMLAVSFKKT
jgi:hypothetical protein